MRVRINSIWLTTDGSTVSPRITGPAERVVLHPQRDIRIHPVLRGAAPKIIDRGRHLETIAFRVHHQKASHGDALLRAFRDAIAHDFAGDVEFITEDDAAVTTHVLTNAHIDPPSRVPGPGPGITLYYTIRGGPFLSPAIVPK